MDEIPLPGKGGVVRIGVIYRVPAPRTPPRRPPDPEVLAAVERGHKKAIREYLERRRAKDG